MIIIDCYHNWTSNELVLIYFKIYYILEYYNILKIYYNLVLNLFISQLVLKSDKLSTKDIQLFFKQ